ncbi:MAG TPA: YHYH domain-containing protein [Campylobacterales bacterium]|nr:YHYH domain-containing protein [Campylobacterales bacterium]
MGINKIILSIALLLFSIKEISAHSGRTDASGCHRNNQTGGYHCHNSNTNDYISTPSTPTNLSVSCQDNQNIELTWNNASNSFFYQVYSSKTCSSTYSYLSTVYSNSYSTDNFDTCNVCFKVQACSSSSCSPYSASVEGKNITEFDYESYQVEDIIDGDTIKLDNMTCHLYGIDTPETYYSSKLYNDAEMCQVNEEMIKKLGEEAKLFLQSTLFNQSFKVNVIGKDNYERNICQIELSGGKSLSEFMIKEGYAVVLEEYIESDSTIELFREYENEAKKELRGLWANYSSIMTCLDHETSIFELNQEVSIGELTVINTGSNQESTRLTVNYQNGSNNIFNINDSQSSLELNENSINIFSTNESLVIDKNATMNLVYRAYDDNNSLLLHEFNSSLGSDELEYIQTVDKNIISYYIDNAIQFIISYFQDSRVIFQYNENSKFTKEINLTTESQIWVDNETETKSLYIITSTPNSIEF